MSREAGRAYSLSNIMAILAMLSILIVVFLVLSSASQAPRNARFSFDLAQQCVFFFLYLTGFLVLRSRYTLVGEIILLVLGNIQITLLSVYYGLSGGIQTYYGLLIIAPLVAIPGTHRYFRYFFCAIPIVLFILIHYHFKILGNSALIPEESSNSIFFFANSTMALLITAIAIIYFHHEVSVAEKHLEMERKRSDKLLLNILPLSIAERLKTGENLIADKFEECTVLFADLVNFTQLSTNTPPETLVRLLDEIFSQFDDAAERRSLEKVKTIGDAYMAVGGVPVEQDDHAERIMELAIEMLVIVEKINIAQNVSLKLRIGIHSGPVVAGVIGKKKFAYDLWGDTVNTASRMESHGIPGSIHITSQTREHLSGIYEFKTRGEIEIKGKGPLETFFLIGPVVG